AVVDGQNEYTVNLAIETGKDLQGKVAVKQGGAAVPGALVSIQGRASRGTNVEYVDGNMNMRGGGGQTSWARAAPAGRFAVTHLATGSYTVMARADGYVAGVASVDLAATNQVTVEVEPELTIEGVVTFADGSPVEGANVNAQRDQPTTSVADGNMGPMAGNA